jgi:hypothetical protein
MWMRIEEWLSQTMPAATAEVDRSQRDAEHVR